MKPDLAVSLEYVGSILTWLETFTNRKLSDNDMRKWAERLLRYPKWRLDRLGAYTGRFDNGVFEFLDAQIFREDESVREDLGYKRLTDDYKNMSALEKECGALLFGGLNKILQTAEKGTAKKKIEELHETLREKYPMFANSLTC